MMVMTMTMRMTLLGSTTSSSISRFLLFIVISILMVGSSFVPFVKGQQEQQDDVDDDDKASLFITNISEEDVTLYWVSPPPVDEEDNNNPNIDNLKNVGVIPSGDGIKMDTYIGHSFIYEIGGGQQRRHHDDNDNTQPPPIIIVMKYTKQTHIIGPKHIQVDCTTTTGKFSAHIIPEWSPFGAARFIHLIHIKYFDGCVLNRVVPNFLTQFGISSNYDLRTEYRTKSILDDEPRGVQFKPGYMAYAGSGPNSRSNEMFVVMPNTPQHQLNAFGNNPWETPFGYVEMDDVENVVANWYSYGDMSPWGNGPDPQKIYLENGYDEYLKQSFPKLSYIEKCEIVSSSDYYDGLANGILLDEEEEEL